MINKSSEREIWVHPEDLKSKAGNHRLLLPRPQSEMATLTPGISERDCVLRAVSFHLIILSRTGTKVCITMIKDIHHLVSMAISLVNWGHCVLP